MALKRAEDVPLGAVGDDGDGIVLRAEGLGVAIGACAALLAHRDHVGGPVGFFDRHGAPDRFGGVGGGKPCGESAAET